METGLPSRLSDSVCVERRKREQQRLRNNGESVIKETSPPSSLKRLGIPKRAE